MTEKKLLECVNKLEIPVLESFHPLVYPSVYIDDFQRAAGLFGNGREQEEKVYIKIHVWSKDKTEMQNLRKKLKENLQKNNINPVIEKGDDSSAGIFRNIFTCEVLDEEGST